MSDIENTIPQLSPVEARVLGCLIEKEKTTPDQYPLSINALLLACNQKTNREPVMDLTTGDVGHCVRALQDRELVHRAFGGRVERYEHRFDKHFGLTLRKQAVLALLMLRGPQTLSELLTRGDRISDFSHIEELQQVVERMMEQSPPLVVNMGRGPGQREDRYMHLLSGAPDPELLRRAEPSVRSSANAAIEERVTALENELAQLRAMVLALPGVDAQQK